MKRIVACCSFVNIHKNLLSQPGTESCLLSHPAHSVVTQNLLHGVTAWNCIATLLHGVTAWNCIATVLHDVKHGTV